MRSAQDRHELLTHWPMTIDCISTILYQQRYMHLTALLAPIVGAEEAFRVAADIAQATLDGQGDPMAIAEHHFPTLPQPALRNVAARVATACLLN